MTSENFRQGSNDLTKLILEERPLGLAISYLDIDYVISHDMQYWFIQEEISSWLNSTLKKVALVVNHNLLLQNSVDNIIEESEKIYERSIPNRYFTDLDRARKWLIAGN